MTDKRFTINNDMSFKDKIETYEVNCVNDNKNKTFYFVADSIQNVQLFIKQLNELYEENKYLKSLKWNQDCINEISIGIQQRQLLEKENERLKKENDKLHQKIFEMRTNIALERTEISKQTYTGKKNEREYLDAKEFLDEIEKW